MTIEYIISKLIEFCPQIALYIFLIALIAFISVKVTKFWMKTNELHKDVPDIKTTLSKIHTGLITLNQVLLENTVIKQSCYSSANSPRIVNEIGKRVLEQSGANALLQTHSATWLTQLESRQFTTLLDLEREAFRLVLSHMNEADFAPLKNFAFEHPTFEDNPLSYTDILYPMSLILRDQYRAKHPEVKADE